MTEQTREYAEIVRAAWPDWEVVERIGSGAFATVVRASRRSRIPGEKDSAVKIIRIPNSESDWDLALAEGRSEEQAERYFQDIVDDSLREIRAMEDLTGNTNIVNIFDYKVHRVPERHAWYILIRMEYLQKVNTAAFREEDVVRMGMDVCTALSICRKKNIVHRDVSLDNVFVHDGNYKLGDFGVAKVLEGTVGTMHSIAGKPLYMAPEVYNATLEETDIDSAARVDIYSLGILLYRLSNRMNYPFEDPAGETVTAQERNEAFRRRVIEGEAVPAPRDASPALAAVILKACAANPDRRYGSADAMKADLAAIAESKKAKPARRHTARNALILLAALAVLAAAAYFLFLRPSPAGEWSAWSEWTLVRKEIADPETEQEESRAIYEWAAVRCANCKAHNPGRSGTCRNCGASLADGEYVYEYSGDMVSEVICDKPLGRYFGGNPYWYSDSAVQYRYREKAAKRVYSAEDVCCEWYYYTYEDAENYPGTVFRADGPERYFSVYSNAERLIMVDHRGSSEITRSASFEDGVLTVGYTEEYTLEGGKLVRRDGSVTETYSREPQDYQLTIDMTRANEGNLRVSDYDGTWKIVGYGVNRMYATAEELGLTGSAEIRDGQLTMSWTRDGREKSQEVAFRSELNEGCLYTVQGGVSYRASMRNGRIILLNVGLDQVQWLLQNVNAVEETGPNLFVPAFEEAFARLEDWTATEETRNELAQLLLDTAAAGGLDTSGIRTENTIYLYRVFSDPEYPAVFCEGTGAYENYVLIVGRGSKSGERFVYYYWDDALGTALGLSGETLADAYFSRYITPIAGDSYWPVQITVSPP